MYEVVSRGVVVFRAASERRCRLWLSRRIGRFAGAFVRRQP